MRRLGVVTTSRADYSLLRPLLKAIDADPDLECWLYVTGGHLLKGQGMTIEDIRNDGFTIRAELDSLSDGDEPADIARGMAETTRLFANQFEKECPDLLVLLGDRFEMHAAAMAAVPFNLCLAHIHGGEATEGMIDEAMRHSLTKFSHIHLVSHPDYARRIVQMGEDACRVTICGAPGLENLNRADLMGDAELEEKTGLKSGEAPLVVTFHPLTLDVSHVAQQCDSFYTSLEKFDGPIVVTRPNMDTHGSIAAKAAEYFVSKSNRHHLVGSLGSRGYFTLLKRARAMVGNSSSGIIEAASFALPVVNVGDRQKGRVHGNNVLDCPNRVEAIRGALAKALTPSFKKSLLSMQNPYDQGGASSIILKVLKETSLGTSLLQKQFNDAKP
ncbi:MAG: UDP-N-acetylglucosamine 2-epimerase [Desulfuromusa sp.]|nr:UDP-N-acetylglucosamine 2-epimerase [Desulfuromusa sp.]